jgi:hypothetical protein
MQIARLSRTRTRIDSFAGWFGPFFNFSFGFALARISTDSPQGRRAAPRGRGPLFAWGRKTMSASAWIASGALISYLLLVLIGLVGQRGFRPSWSTRSGTSRRLVREAANSSRDMTDWLLWGALGDRWG